MKAEILKVKDGCLLVEVTAEPFTAEMEAWQSHADRLHPFYRLALHLRQLEYTEDSDFDEIRAGRWREYVADNPVTRGVISMLNMDDETLSPLTGNTSVDDYQALLVRVLDTLWD